MMRLFSVLLLFIVLTSCDIEKRCGRLNNRINKVCPLQAMSIETDSSDVKETIKIKEVIIKVPIPVDSLAIKSEVDCPNVPESTYESSRVKVVYKIKNDTIFITATCKADSLMVVNREITRERDIFKKRFKEELVKEPQYRTKKFFIICTWGFFILLFLIITVILLRKYILQRQIIRNLLNK